MATTSDASPQSSKHPANCQMVGAPPVRLYRGTCTRSSVWLSGEMTNAQRVRAESPGWIRVDGDCVLRGKIGELREHALPPALALLTGPPVARIREWPPELEKPIDLFDDFRSRPELIRDHENAGVSREG